MALNCHVSKKKKNSCAYFVSFLITIDDKDHIKFMKKNPKLNWCN